MGGQRHLHASFILELSVSITDTGTTTTGTTTTGTTTTGTTTTEMTRTSAGTTLTTSETSLATDGATRRRCLLQHLDGRYYWTSPNYPDPYPNHIHCGLRVISVILKIVIPRRLCNTLKWSQRVHVSASFFYIKFSTDDRIVRRGFNISIEGVSSSCHKTIQETADSQGVIELPGLSYYEKKEEHCEYRVQAPEGYQGLYWYCPALPLTAFPLLDPLRAVPLGVPLLPARVALTPELTLGAVKGQSRPSARPLSLPSPLRDIIPAGSLPASSGEMTPSPSPSPGPPEVKNKHKRKCVVLGALSRHGNDVSIAEPPAYQQRHSARNWPETVVGK
ncbi:hypothetical protein O3P69_016228 [Scylla paramamosain]|uniref:CUB domain-containing protein n=1 Tax=Scylla paramamosain TaxID=85552 RepID=A0AAW0SA61_SCYPA